MSSVMQYPSKERVLVKEMLLLFEEGSVVCFAKGVVYKEEVDFVFDAHEQESLLCFHALAF